MSAWSRAAQSLHAGVMRTFGETVTVTHADGTVDADVTAAWDWESDELSDRRFLMIFLDESQLSQEIASSARFAIGGEDYRVIGGSIERRESGVQLHAEVVR